jgi:hypothetical protein
MGDCLILEQAIAIFAILSLHFADSFCPVLIHYCETGHPIIKRKTLEPLLYVRNRLA